MKRILILLVSLLLMVVSSNLVSAAATIGVGLGSNVTNDTSVWRWEKILVYSNWTEVVGYSVEHNQSGSFANTSWALATGNWTNYTLSINGMTAGKGVRLRFFVWDTINGTDANESSGIWQWNADSTAPKWASNLTYWPQSWYSPDYQKVYYINVSDNLSGKGTTTGVHTVFMEENSSGTPTNNTCTGGSTTGNASYSFLQPAGYFYWKFWFNDTSDNWNSTAAWNSTVEGVPSGGGGGGAGRDDVPDCGDGRCAWNEDKNTCPKDCGVKLPEPEERAPVIEEPEPLETTPEGSEGMSLEMAFLIFFLGLFIFFMLVVYFFGLKGKKRR